MELDPSKAFALQALSVKEAGFLEAFGWTSLDNGMWKPPPGYLAHKGVASGAEPTYDKGHAINSQKWVIKNR